MVPRSHAHGITENSTLTVGGVVVMALQYTPEITQLLGSLAVFLGVIYSTIRIYWDWEDRQERKRESKPIPLIKAEKIYLPETPKSL